MSHPTPRYLATLLMLVVTAGPAVAADEILAVARTANPIVIDGDVSEIEWAGIETHPLPWEIDPRRVAVTTWETSARISHDGTRLLVAIRAQDNEPERVVSSRGARDSVGNEDFVAVLIDAEGGRQRHFVFRVNAAGVLEDEIVGRGNNGSPEWSGTWEAVARRTDYGYAVEMSIPLSTLNASIQADGGLQLAINVERHIGRDRRETLAMEPVDITNVCHECQYQVMSLASADEARQFLEVRPYVTTRQRSHYPEFGEDDSSTEFDGGIDLLWKFGGGRKLVATINPDFSEIEPDTIQFDVNRRFAASYAENRPFFTENASQFGSLIPLVYTRSITDPAAAVAYVAQGSRLQAAAIAASDRETNIIVAGQEGSRLVSIDQESHNLLARAQLIGEAGRRIGVLMTGRAGDGYSNYTASVDGRQVFGENQSLEGIVAFSQADASEELAARHALLRSETGNAQRLIHNYDNGVHGANTVLSHLSEGFRADAGRLERRGTIFALHEQFWNIARPPGEWLRNYGGGVAISHLSAESGPSISSDISAWGYASLPDGSGIDANLFRTRETYRGTTFDMSHIGGSVGWQINDNTRWSVGGAVYSTIDVFTVELADGTNWFTGMDISLGEKWVINFSYSQDVAYGDVTRDFATTSAVLRARWSPWLGHTFSLVANYGGSWQQPHDGSGPRVHQDYMQGQFLYLYQRTDRSSFNIGINTGGTGHDGFGSVQRTDELLFAKIILNFDWGS